MYQLVDKFGNTFVELNNKKGEGKLNLNKQLSYSFHRSGWNYALHAINSLHNENGILFEGVLDYAFSWGIDNNYRKLPFEEPWVGFFHNPPNIPKWLLTKDDIKQIIKSPDFKESLMYCKGIYTLSNYLKDFLISEEINIEIEALIHPTEKNVKPFSLEEFFSSRRKKIIQIGYWLRKLSSFYLLNVSSNFQKIRFLTSNESIFRFENQKYFENTSFNNSEDVICIPHVNNNLYDDFLAESIVFLDLFDSSANNAIIECIVRNTPILVNKLPAVIEYLGKEYPFYFESLSEAMAKLNDQDLIRDTHLYIKEEIDKDLFTAKTFKQSILNSKIYQSL